MPRSQFKGTLSALGMTEQVKNLGALIFFNGPHRASFSLYLSFQYFYSTMEDVILLMTGFEHQILVLEATALSTEPPPLPKYFWGSVGI